MEIDKIHARQILDSRGNPTVEADITLKNGAFGRAAVPSGASTGSGEALELRDKDSHYGGKGVIKAVDNINDLIAKKILRFDASKQQQLDDLLIDLDGTTNKAHLGANAILAVSLAASKATAVAKNMPYYQYIAELSGQKPSLPMPMMNIMNGGQHALGSTDVQEFMIVPVGADSIATAVEIGANVFHALAGVLAREGYATTVGDEGGFAPRLKQGNEEALALIISAITKAGYKPGKDVAIALDVAASELVKDESTYYFATEKRELTSQQLIDWYDTLRVKYPIASIEDGLSENDWDGWVNITARLGNALQLVGDDLLVTNTKLLQKAIDCGAANAILIKPNQIGSLSETIAAVKLAKENNYRTIMSHRSGETEDVSIAHLAVGLDCGQIKTGSLSRSERVAKYNELLRISETVRSFSKF